ncbi:MAG: energy transducer TonB [Pyrinomonadaceae bacterium]|nr:energy transducer TonB [Pyrinomonadaceae bacterium]
MLKRRSILFALIVFSILIVSTKAQDSKNPPPPQIVNSGVVNGKALNLVKPEYPKPARYANASGAVGVEVLIDETGKVVSATAVSGHPLLRATAVIAARQSTFSPTKQDGQPVKVSGTIIYNFTPDKFNWFKIGSSLAVIENAPAVKSYQWEVAGNFLQKDWTFERQQLQRLEELRQAEIAQITQNSEQTGDKPNIVQNPNSSKAENIVRETKVPFFIKPPLPEQISIAQSLIAAFQGRLATNEKDLWCFNSGLYLSEFISTPKPLNAKQDLFDRLRQHSQNAPSGITPEAIAELQKIVEIFGKKRPTPSDLVQVREQFSRIQQAFSAN